VNCIPRCGGGRAAAVVQEETATVAQEEANIDGDGGHREFGMKSEMTWRRLLFIGSKISAAVLN
jgi:hypothetical protein